MTTREVAAQGAEVKRAAVALGQASDEQRRNVLLRVADRFEEVLDDLVAVNVLDLDAYDETGPGRDRLLLTKERVLSMASALREIATRPIRSSRCSTKALGPTGCTSNGCACRWALSASCTKTDPT